MHMSIRPICGVGVGFEILEAKYIPELDDDGVYLVVELLLFRVVVNLN
jgi:hypothetical protein